MDEDRERLHAIEKKLHYKFQHLPLLKVALTHRSYLDEGEKGQEDNGRLEFLGDAVLDLIVTSFLYNVCAYLSEGSLTQLKEQMVDMFSLRTYALQLGLEEDILVGKGLEKNLKEVGILADLFESILGAIYIDGGLEAAEKFFLGHFQTSLHEKIAEPRRNWKRELQELYQKEHQVNPEYLVINESGQPHNKEFRVAVVMMGQIMGEGSGKSKKEAEMNAAEDTIKRREGTR